MNIDDYKQQQADKCVNGYVYKDSSIISLMHAVFSEGFNAGSRFHRLLNYPHQEPQGNDWLIVCHDPDGYPIAISKRIMLRDFYDWERFCSINRVINWQYVEQVL